MKKYNSFYKAGGVEEGQAMLEFCIVLPVIMMIFISTFELGRALTQYLSLSRIAYEGARYAASLPGLEEEEYTSEPDSSVMHSQVWKILRRLFKINNFDFEYVSIATEHAKDSMEGDPMSNDRVKVSIEMMYRPLFVSFDLPELPIKVEAAAPYLFPNNDG